MSAPGGLSDIDFKAMALEVGQWVWGTAQGAFNEKATLSQIITDAVIGMIPVAGDVTAARDLIAVTIGLAESPQKREDPWEWVLLVVFIFALIPVIGGAAKGVGRLIVSGARNGNGIAKTALDAIEVLNRIGGGHAEKWLKSFSFSAYQAQVLEEFRKLLNMFNTVLMQIRLKLGRWIPSSLLARIEALEIGLTMLKEEAVKRIPDAIKELDQKLREIQAYIHSGGETTSKATTHAAATGERGATYANEATLVEGAKPMRSLRGGIMQNTANAKHPESYANVYKHEPGYPDLTSRPDNKTGEIAAIKAFGGKIVNRELREGEQLFRLFGPEGVTLTNKVDGTSPGGVWWGVGKPPKDAKEWRMNSAVLDEWNRDGFLVTATLQKEAKIKACVGMNSEMYGKSIPGQYLPGGGTQAFFFLNEESAKVLAQKGQEVVASGKPVQWVDQASGMRLEIKPTGWTDANGVHGYLESAHPAYVQAVKLETRELAAKDNRETPISEGKK